MRLNEPMLRVLGPRPTRNAAKQKIWDGYVAALVSDEAAQLLEKYGVSKSIPRLARFLGNAAHESGGFTLIWESGAYSASTIMRIFGVGRHSAGITQSEANRIAALPVRGDGSGPRCEALFERAYGLGNPRKAAELGNDQPGDGWKHRGLGLQQITGKRDQQRYAYQVGCRKEDLGDPINTIHAALLEWDRKGCNALADIKDRDEADRRVRKAINGGYNGMPDVRQRTRKAEKLLAAIMDEEIIEPARPKKSAKAGDRILELGDTGAEVYWLQQQLMIHGYYVGNLDSEFGLETEKQVTAWQLQHGFPATGRISLDDREQMDALNLAPKRTEDAAPKRDITGKDLADRGSRTVGLAQRIKGWIKWLWSGMSVLVGGEAAGLEPIEHVVATGEQVQGLIGRSTALVGTTAPPTWVFVMGGVLLVSGIVYLIAHKFEWFRIEDAQSGAHMGR